MNIRIADYQDVKNEEEKAKIEAENLEMAITTKLAEDASESYWEAVDAAREDYEAQKYETEQYQSASQDYNLLTGR